MCMIDNLAKLHEKQSDAQVSGMFTGNGVQIQSTLLKSPRGTPRRLEQFDTVSGSRAIMAAGNGVALV